MNKRSPINHGTALILLVLFKKNKNYYFYKQKVLIL